MALAGSRAAAGRGRSTIAARARTARLVADRGRVTWVRRIWGASRPWTASGAVLFGRRQGNDLRDLFGRLGHAREVQMLAHLPPGALGVAVADGRVDAAVHLRGLLEVARALHGEAPPLVHEGGHHLHQRR